MSNCPLFSFPLLFLSSTICYTVCFTDLGKLNLPMVEQFKAQANFCYCPSCIIKWSSLLKWSKSTQNKWLANNGLNLWNSLYVLGPHLVYVPHIDVSMLLSTLGLNVDAIVVVDTTLIVLNSSGTTMEEKRVDKERQFLTFSSLRLQALKQTKISTFLL